MGKAGNEFYIVGGMIEGQVISNKVQKFSVQLSSGN